MLQVTRRWGGIIARSLHSNSVNLDERWLAPASTRMLRRCWWQLPWYMWSMSSSNPASRPSLMIAFFCCRVFCNDAGVLRRGGESCWGGRRLITLWRGHSGMHWLHLITLILKCYTIWLQFVNRLVCSARYLCNFPVARMYLTWQCFEFWLRIPTHWIRLWWLYYLHGPQHPSQLASSSSLLVSNLFDAPEQDWQDICSQIV